MHYSIKQDSSLQYSKHQCVEAHQLQFRVYPDIYLKIEKKNVLARSNHMAATSHSPAQSTLGAAANSAFRFLCILPPITNLSIRARHSFFRFDCCKSKYQTRQACHSDCDIMHIVRAEKPSVKRMKDDARPDS